MCEEDIGLLHVAVVCLSILATGMKVEMIWGGDSLRLPHSLLKPLNPTQLPAHMDD